nr:integrase arm-type DNA-binding domain-containing protein [uncultured Cohaesibacter sp.]
MAKKWTELHVKNIKHEGKTAKLFKESDVRGLYLRVNKNGAKSWLYRYVSPTRKGKTRDLGLGAYPTVGLKDARDRAVDAARLVVAGTDPLDKREEYRTELHRTGMTVGKALDDYYSDVLERSGISPRTKKQWLNATGRYVNPAWKHKLLGSITAKDVRELLLKDDFWTTKPRMAADVRKYLSDLFEWGMDEENKYCESNPARMTPMMKSKLGPQPKAKHQPSLNQEDVARWYAALRCMGGTGSRALQFLALTALRSGDVRGMTWDEISEDDATLTIKAERLKIKNQGDHMVPLSAQALALLKAQPRTDSPFVFPALKGGMLSDMTLSAAMRRMNEQDQTGFVDSLSGKPAVPHGLRSTFRVWSQQHGVDWEVAENVLAHKVGDKVYRAYARDTFFQQRISVMQAWADFLQGIDSSNVVRLHG